MKKLLTLLTLTIVLLSFGCKKDAEQTATPKDNQTDNQTQAPLTDMEPFKKSLSILKNPQYDLLYKLIEKGGVNAQLEEDVTIGYPSHAKRLLINEPQITIQKGATPLGIAALFCTPSLVNDLIEKGADLKAKTNGMEISAIIIQCGEAEQAGMFENYLDKVRKFEKANPSIYEDKPALYAANAIIKENLTDEDGKGKTILNYAVENNLNDAIPVIIKYAGGINFTNRNDENNDQMPVITALKSKNYEALNFFFTKTASLYIDMKAEDGTDTNIINYIYNTYKTNRTIKNTKLELKETPNNKELIAYCHTKEQYEACLELNIKAYYKDNYLSYNETKVLNDNDILISNYGSIYLNKGKDLTLNKEFNVLNHVSLAYFLKYAKNVTLSQELSFNEIKNLITNFKNKYNFYPNVDLIIYGHMTLMTTKYCPIKHIGKCPECKTHQFSLKDDTSTFPLIHNNCITSILNGKSLNLIDEIDKLYPYINRFRLDFTIENKEETKIILNKAIKKFNNFNAPNCFNPNTDTRGYYKREII